jgi:hypothetical protein
VAYVVKQCGGTDGDLVVRGNRVFNAEFGEYTRGEMKSTEAVCKPGVLGPLIGEMCQAELPDPAEPLKLGRIYQAGKKLILRRAAGKCDDVMDRVPVYSLVQFTFSDCENVITNNAGESSGYAVTATGGPGIQRLSVWPKMSIIRRKSKNMEHSVEPPNRPGCRGPVNILQTQGLSNHERPFT